MKYHALFVIFEKAAKFAIHSCLLQIIGGALRVNLAFFLKRNLDGNSHIENFLSLSDGKMRSCRLYSSHCYKYGIDPSIDTYKDKSTCLPYHDPFQLFSIN